VASRCDITTIIIDLDNPDHSFVVGVCDNLRVTSTGVMGAIGYFLSYQPIFLASATLALPFLLALSRISSTEIHFGRACGQPDHHAPTPPPRTRRLMLCKNYGLLIFGGCLFLFQFANASVWPLAGEELVYRNGTSASLIVSILIIVPQIVVALTAPWAGREAQNWGRRPLLLLGFSALTMRALLFAVTINPWLLLFIQLLDGTTGSTLGVLTALIAADLTKGTGRFNLAQGFVGTLAGVGASLSTTFFSLIAGNFGGAIGFISIACVALSLVLSFGFGCRKPCRQTTNSVRDLDSDGPNGASLAFDCSRISIWRQHARTLRMNSVTSRRRVEL